MYPKLVEQIIELFARFPGVGRRSAERMVFWLMNRPPDDAHELAKAMVRLKEEMRFCPQCNSLTDKDLCPICQDERRDRSIICVVENPKDLIAIERTGVYKGLYHVLLGALSPSDGRGPDDLPLGLLKERVSRLGVKEVVIATDPDTEGEMTALHIMEELKPLGVKVSRIGLGLPMGSSVEYVDHSTLTMSMSVRREM
ncbi:MAG: recombination mediator RecR [Candidatus Omnitrophota bacterium]